MEATPAPTEAVPETTSETATDRPRRPGPTGDVFGIIADPTRRRLLTALRGQELSVGDLVIELAVSQPTVSKHLRTLREGGLVRMRASGQRRLYSLRLEPLAEAAGWLGGFGLDGGAGGGQAREDHGVDAVGIDGAGTDPTGRGRREPVGGVAAANGPDRRAAAADRGEATTAATRTGDAAGEDAAASPIQRTVRGAAGRAAEMIASIPRLRRRGEKH